MLFNSIEFAIFLPIVFLLYWFVFRSKLISQNLFLIIVSYFFYGWWDWRFLFLIAFSSMVDYLVGININNQKSRNIRKLLLFTSITVNIGLLGVFKYYNFFIESFSNAFMYFGQHIDPQRLNIILPVGISFYTFQTLSYTIDVYKKKLNPTTDIVSFFAFVSFFPQLVAGPIERASNLLPQFFQKRQFDYYNAVDGLKQMLWGFFKKVVIADNAAQYANQIFENYHEYNSATLLLGAFYFSFQIYGDFSGYSDIAIGTSKLFGFKLKKNFAFPYFSRDIAEFWRRWHISLSTWFRDYLYIPLGGSRGGLWMKIRNTFIIFIVSGFWHGANWTFIVWGALNALYFLPVMLSNKNRVHLKIAAEGKILPTFKEVLQILSTFVLTMLAWVFFRSETVTDAIYYLNGIISNFTFEMPQVFSARTTALIFLFIIIEWFGRENEYCIERFPKNWNNLIKWTIFVLIGLMIFIFHGKQQEFIYFQF